MIIAIYRNYAVFDLACNKLFFWVVAGRCYGFQSGCQALDDHQWPSSDSICCHLLCSPSCPICSRLHSAICNVGQQPDPFLAGCLHSNSLHIWLCHHFALLGSCLVRIRVFVQRPLFFLHRTGNYLLLDLVYFSIDKLWRFLSVLVCCNVDHSYFFHCNFHAVAVGCDKNSRPATSNRAL